MRLVILNQGENDITRGLTATSIAARTYRRSRHCHVCRHKLTASTAAPLLKPLTLMLEAKVEANSEAPAAGAPPPSTSDMANYSPKPAVDTSLKSEGNALTFGSAFANLSGDAKALGSDAKALGGDAKSVTGDAKALASDATGLMNEGENALGKLNNSLTNDKLWAEMKAYPYIDRVQNALFNQPGNNPSVVEVNAQIPANAWGSTDSEGTGFFVTPDSLVTAYHVISGSDGPITATLPDGQTLPAQVAKIDKPDDLALLTVTGANEQISPLQVASDASASPTDYLYGHPYANPQTKFTGTFKESLPISQVQPPGWIDPEDPDRNMNMKIDAFAMSGDPGVSGSPIVNSAGQVVSVADMGNSYYAYGIPAQAINNLLT
jgi:S1-C subfamily serine protease